jgi:hypothetical protein
MDEQFGRREGSGLTMLTRLREHLLNFEMRRPHWLSVKNKSFQSGLVSSIRRIFQARFHFLIWYSRVLALSRVS